MAWLLDGLAIIFILILGYNGFNRGLIEEFGRLIGLVLSIIVSISNTNSFSNKISQIVLIEEWVITTFSFTLLFISTLIISRILTRIFNLALLSHGNQMMNRSLGFTFGSFKGFFIVMLFVWFIALLPLMKWTLFIENNSRVSRFSNQFRLSMVSFFNWDDPIKLSESYIKQLTQP